MYTTAYIYDDQRNEINNKSLIFYNINITTSLATTTRIDNSYRSITIDS
jgi:hypothetical protein